VQPLLTLARTTHWQALHALAQCTARVLLAAQGADSGVEEDWAIVSALAHVSVAERDACVLSRLLSDGTICSTFFFW
jgi:hypothetical protein